MTELGTKYPAQDAPKLADELRQMRKAAIRLNSSALEHLRALQQEDDSFKTLPPPKSKSFAEDPNISVGSTCTALMAVLSTGTHKQLWSKAKGVQDKTQVDIGKLFERVVESRWESSGLPDGNAFTTALVVRTAGFVVKSRVLSSVKAIAIKHPPHDSTDERGRPCSDSTVSGKSLKEIIETKARSPEKFSFSGYPAKTTIAYWFLDGALNADVDLGDSLSDIAVWAVKQ